MIDKRAEHNAIIQEYIDELFRTFAAVTKKYNVLLGVPVVIAGRLLTTNVATFDKTFRPKGIFIVWTGDTLYTDTDSVVGTAKSEVIGRFSPDAIAQAVVETLVETLKRRRDGTTW